MKKNVLLGILGLTAVSLSAQLSNGGTGYTLDNTNASSQCYLNSAPNNGGIISPGNTLTASASTNSLASASGPLELTSVATVPVGGSVTWFGLPTIQNGQCETMYSTNQGVDLTSSGKITLSAEASAIGATLEFYLGGEGQWNPATSTYNTGSGSSIIASHTFTTANAAETINFDLATLDATVWAGWAGKNKIQSIGYRSGTNAATFKIYSVKLGADAVTSGGGGGGGGGTGSSSCTSTKDDGLAEATFYYLLETGASTTVTCSFDAVNDIKGTFYGALETARLHGSQAKTEPAKYCGMCASVTGPAGTATVHIADECPDCKDKNVGDTDIDLSPQAFAAIVGSESVGRASITWNEVSCPWTSPIHIIVQGSNQWYCKVIVGNTVNRVAKVEVKQGSTYYDLVRREDNGWESTGSPAEGNINEVSKTFRVTDIYGEQIEVSGIDFSSNPTASKTNGPKNFTACTVTSAENINPLDYISAFPNPADDNIRLEGLEGVNSIVVYSSVGSVVGQQNLDGSTGSIGLDVSALAPGVYVLQFGSNEGYSGTKTIVVK